MSRDDLRALTREALAALSNLGLVKRAERELAAGTGPVIEEEPGGTVVGTFPDGVVARLAPGTTLKSTSCTCGASGVCRHRVAVVLAYKAGPEGQESALTTDVRSRGSTPEAAAWSPGELTDEALETALGPKTVARARESARRGMMVTIEPGAVPVAHLPSCTVRFLVPGVVTYAKCDCALSGGACEHLALSVWAFRKAGPKSASFVVTLGETAAPADHEPLERTHHLVSELLVTGVANVAPSAQRFASLRSALAASKMSWLRSLVTDLQIAWEGHAARSALYGVREISAILVEIGARLRAARTPSAELPARFVLGQDEAEETLLDHLRLVSLGARVRGDQRARLVEVYFADTATCLVLCKRWDYAEGKDLENGPSLGRRSMAGGASLNALASGQIVSKVVSRAANRSFTLGRARGGNTSVAPQRGEYQTLPAPLLVTDLERHAEYSRGRPPRLIRPRVLADRMHVVAVSSVENIRHLVAEQTLRASLRDSAGCPFEVVVKHQSATPTAIDAAASALSSGVRFVAGELTPFKGAWRLEPTAIASDTLVVPDLADVPRTPWLSSASERATTDRLDSAFLSAQSSLEEMCLVGVASAPDVVLSRVRAAAAELESLGANGMAQRLHRLAQNTRSREPSAHRTPSEQGSAAWLDAAIRLALLTEPM